MEDRKLMCKKRCLLVGNNSYFCILKRKKKKSIGAYFQGWPPISHWFWLLVLVFSKTFLCPQKWSQWGTEQKADVFCHLERFCETAGKRHGSVLLYIHLLSQNLIAFQTTTRKSERSYLLCFSLGRTDLYWWWSSLFSLWAFQFSFPSMFCSWPLSVFPPPLLWCYFLLRAEVTTASLFLDCVWGDWSSLFTTRKSCSNKGLWQVTPSAAAWVPSCRCALLEGEKL